jgi:electron transfer flavoprotein beta subunit
LVKILVLVKQVPETSNVRIDEATGTMVREGVESIINPHDLYAIEIALQLRERHGGSVTAMSLGPRRAERELREALAMGCDDAALLSDAAFAGSDTLATSYALSQAARHAAELDGGRGFDLIVCGVRATDGETGQVGPGMAAFLDYHVATYVSGITEELDTDGHRLTQITEITETTDVCGSAEESETVVQASAATSEVMKFRESMSGAVPTPKRVWGCHPRVITVERLVEGGYETLRVPLPAVLTVVKEIANPRLPTLRGKQRARAQVVPVWGPKEIGADLTCVGLRGSPTRVVKITRPKATRAGTIVDAAKVGAEAAARMVVEYLVTGGWGLVVGERRETTDAVMRGRGDAGTGNHYSDDAQAGLPVPHCLGRNDNRDDAQPRAAVPQHEGTGNYSCDDAQARLPVPHCAGPIKIWALGEQTAGAVRPVTHEMLAWCRKLAEKAGKAEIGIVVLGKKIHGGDVEELIARGADRVVVIEDEQLEYFRAEPYAEALREALSRERPAVFLAAATSMGRTLMPYLAVRLNAGLTADCTDLECEPGTDNLLQTRPAIGGNVMATITSSRRPQMATVRPHAIRAAKVVAGHRGAVEAFVFDTDVHRWTQMGEQKEKNAGAAEEVAGHRGRAEFICAAPPPNKCGGASHAIEALYNSPP